MSEMHPLERLDAYQEGELPADERGEVKGHLETCAACRARLQALRGLGRRLSSLPREAPPEGLARRIVAAIREREEALAGRRLARHLRVPALATLAAVLVLLQGLLRSFQSGLLDVAGLILSDVTVTLAYPTETTAALLEFLPALQLVLSAALLGLALLSLGQLALTPRRKGGAASSPLEGSLLSIW